MSHVNIASAIAPYEADVTTASPSNDNGLKRSHSPEPAPEQEPQSKRQRTSPGKSSSPIAKDSAEPEKSLAVENDTVNTEKARKKPAIADEKQRSKRLFGALLGKQNPPSDRAAKRRQEIESRRKAEQQRQGDKREEDDLRRAEDLLEERKKAQIRVHEENMRIRHRNLLEKANFLQTSSEPRIYYRPWDLRTEEEDLIDKQIIDAQSQIDRELGEHDPSQAPSKEATNLEAADQLINGQNGTTDAADEGHVRPAESAVGENGEDPASAKSTNIEAHTSAEVPDSENTNQIPADIVVNRPAVAVQKEDKREEEEEEEQVVDGDEDTVIY